MGVRFLKQICILAAVLIVICPGRPAGAQTGEQTGLQAFSPLIEKVIVKIKGGRPDRQEKLHQMASEIIRVKPGAPLLEKELLLSIELLKQTGRFSRIEVPDQNWEAASVDLVFILTPVMMIKNITVSGAFPIFKDEVIHVTDYVPGKGFNPDQVEMNRTAVSDLLIRNGYIRPDVDISAKKENDLEVSVHIQIDKHEYFRISRIDISGSWRISETRLKMMMKTYQMPIFFWSRGERVIKDELEKDIKTLVAFYRKKGFAEVKIEHALTAAGSSNDLTAQLIIDEGPEYRIHFDGNQAFSAFTLKKDLILEAKGNINDFGLKKSIKNMTERYRLAGYPDCRIDYTGSPVTKNGRMYKDIHINIIENTRYLVRSSTIRGMAAIDEKTLRNEVLTREKSLMYDGPFVETRFKNDKTAIEGIYRSRGYIDTQVDAGVKWTDKENIRYADVQFDIFEGYQRVITRLEVEGLPDSLLPQIKNLMETSTGKPFIKSVVQKDRQEIIAFLAKKGYIHAEVEARVTDGDKKEEVTIKFIIDPKVKSEAGGVWAFGNLRTKDEVLVRHNTIGIGAPVSLDDFTAWQKHIRSMNCIERASFKVVGLQENLDRVFFLAEVEEKKPYFLEFGAGFDTARDAYLNVSAGDRNFMGMNRILSLDAEFSGVGYDVSAGLKDFDLFSRYIVTELSVYTSREELKNQTFGTDKTGSSLSFEKDLSRFLKAGTSLGVEVRKQFETQASADMDPDDLETRGLFNITPFITWSSTDSFVKPTRGFYVNASAGYYKDVLENLDNFMKYRLRAKYYFQPFSRLVVAVQGMYGYIQNLSGAASPPDDQLFYLGGISDIRGYGENELVRDSLGDPVGGKTQTAASVEARIDLGNNFEIPLFLDAGSISGTEMENEPDGFKYTVGTGIRYMTPVGPVGVLYGYKLNPEDGEDRGMFHFSIGYTF